MTLCSGWEALASFINIITFVYNQFTYCFGTPCSNNVFFASMLEFSKGLIKIVIIYLVLSNIHMRFVIGFIV